MPIELFREIASRTRSEAYFFNSELLLLSERMGIPVVELPVDLRGPEARTSVRFVVDSCRFLTDLIALRFRTLSFSRSRLGEIA
jgi:hypothetical protein